MKKPRHKILKYLHLTWVVLLYLPVALFYHIFFVYRYGKHPEKYPIEKRYRVIRKEIRGLLKLLRIDIRVEGLEEYYLNNPNKAILIISHQAILDPLIFIAACPRPTSFLSKIEVKKYPLASSVIKALDGLYIDRAKLMTQMDTIREIVKRAKSDKHASIGIYIEGHRNDHPEGDVQEYKAGTIKTAYMTKTDLINVANYGEFRVVSPRYHLKRYVCYLHFFKPIHPEEYKNIDNFTMAANLMKETNEEIDKIRLEDIEYYEHSKETKRGKREALLVSRKTPLIAKVDKKK